MKVKIQLIKTYGIHMKVVLRGKFLALNACIRIGAPNIYNLKFCHRKLEKGVQFKSKASRKKK